MTHARVERNDTHHDSSMHKLVDLGFARVMSKLSEETRAVNDLDVGPADVAQMLGDSSLLEPLREAQRAARGHRAARRGAQTISAPARSSPAEAQPTRSSSRLSRSAHCGGDRRTNRRQRRKRNNAGPTMYQRSSSPHSGAVAERAARAAHPRSSAPRVLKFPQQPCEATLGPVQVTRNFRTLRKQS